MYRSDFIRLQIGDVKSPFLAQRLQLGTRPELHGSFFPMRNQSDRKQLLGRITYGVGVTTRHLVGQQSAMRIPSPGFFNPITKSLQAWSFSASL